MSIGRLAGLLLEGDGPEDEVRVYFGDVCTTREELRASARRLRDALRGAGLPRRTPVGVMLPNGAPLVAAIFGVLAADAAYVPLNPRLSDGELTAIIEDVRPAAVVTDQPDRVPGRLAQVVPAANHAPLMGAGRHEPMPDESARLESAAHAGRPERAPDSAVRPGSATDHDWTVVGTIDPATPTLGEDVAFVQFTSGTTGRPKPVPLRAATVLALMDGVVAKLHGARPPRPGDSPEHQPDRRPGDGVGESSATDRPDRPTQRHPEARPAAAADRPHAERRAAMPNLIPLSLSLWAGIYNVLFAFRVGAPVVLMAQFETREFARLVRAFGIRSVVLPPAAMTMLADDEAVRDLTPLRLVRSVSAPLSPLLARRFKQRFGATVLNGYGQTELGGEVIGWSAADARAHGDDKLGAIGRPHAGIELRVVGDDGAALPADEVGELWIRTPHTRSGATDLTLADRLSPDGYLRTGDLARIDPDGFVWLCGRRSDVINRGGLKVFPAEVAEVLRLHPAVSDAAVVGVPDERLGELPWAFVVASPPITADELGRHCRQHLSPYKLPAEVVHLPELPRNEMGKVMAHRLVELAEDARRARAGGSAADGRSARDAGAGENAGAARDTRDGGAERAAEPTVSQGAAEQNRPRGTA